MLTQNCQCWPWTDCGTVRRNPGVRPLSSFAHDHILVAFGVWNRLFALLFAVFFSFFGNPKHLLLNFYLQSPWSSARLAHWLLPISRGILDLTADCCTSGAVTIQKERKNLASGRGEENSHQKENAWPFRRSHLRRLSVFCKRQTKYFAHKRCYCTLQSYAMLYTCKSVPIMSSLLNSGGGTIMPTY